MYLTCMIAKGKISLTAGQRESFRAGSIHLL
jgi:hypothetical protein